MATDWSFAAHPREGFRWTAAGSRRRPTTGKAAGPTPRAPTPTATKRYCINAVRASLNGAPFAVAAAYILSSTCVTRYFHTGPPARDRRGAHTAWVSLGPTDSTSLPSSAAPLPSSSLLTGWLLSTPAPTIRLPQAPILPLPQTQYFGLSVPSPLRALRGPDVVRMATQGNIMYINFAPEPKTT